MPGHRTNAQTRSYGVAGCRASMPGHRTNVQTRSYGVPGHRTTTGKTGAVGDGTGFFGRIGFKMSDLYYYDRSNGELRREKILGDFFMRLAYNYRLGKLLHWPLFGQAFFSRLLGYYADCRVSRRRIAGTIKDLGIDMSEVAVPEQGFACFNDFFARRLKADARPLAAAKTTLISPADCRLLVYPRLEALDCIPVKGSRFNVAELLGAPGGGLAGEFAGGSLCVCRLCPADYHRYHFPADGKLLRRWLLRGKYHSVHPFALHTGLKVFTQNLRQVNELELVDLGKAAFIEVGAFAVSSIQETFGGGEFRKGEEKGYFAFGGSTIIMIFRAGSIEFDADLVAKSAENMECLVRMGEQIATIVAPSGR